MNPRFGRVITAMITPFNSDGSLDVQGACDLAQWLAEQGNNALVLAGTTGESPTITQDEQIQLVEAVAQAVDIPVIAGAGSNDTRSAITNTQRCEQAGALADGGMGARTAAQAREGGGQGSARSDFIRVRQRNGFWEKEFGAHERGDAGV